MRRYVPLLIAGAALIAAACSDSVAPTRSANESDLSTLSALGAGAGSYGIRGNKREESTAKSFSFQIRPQGGTVRVGGFILRYPAHAVCDPSTSGYGPDTWKNSCQTLNQAIAVTAKVWVESGRTHADFSPDIRFDPSKDVVMSVKIRDIKGDVPQADWADKYGIWYSTRIGDERFYINDAEGNPELASVFETSRKGRATGWVSRKIWHFSGYYVRSGRVCDEASPDCESDPSLMQ